MAYQKDPRVDDYIDPLPEWQQASCHEVRDLVHTADPEVEETINAPALTAMFEQIIADNRAGGWRKLNQQGS